MKKKFKILGIILVVFITICIYAYSRDNIRFKISYEIANYYEYSNGKSIKLNIPIDNKVKYINNKKLLELMDNGTGIIYFGYNTCPWCRNSIPILIEAVKENKINTLYYVDIHNFDFESIKEAFHNKFDDYLSVDDDGNKRLAVPDAYVIKNGKILNHHLGTVDSYKNPYLGMSTEQKQELKEIYNNLIKELE